MAVLLLCLFSPKPMVWTGSLATLPALSISIGRSPLPTGSRSKRISENHSSNDRRCMTCIQVQPDKPHDLISVLALQPTACVVFSVLWTLNGWPSHLSFNRSEGRMEKGKVGLWMRMLLGRRNPSHFSHWMVILLNLCSQTPPPISPKQGGCGPHHLIL